MIVEISKPETFVNALALLSTFGNEHVLRFEKNRLVTIALDNVACLQMITFNKSIFSKYPEINEDEPKEVSVVINQITKALKGIKENTILTMNFGDNLDRIEIAYTQKRQFNYQLRVLDFPQDYNFKEIEKPLSKVNAPNNIVVDVGEVTDTIENLVFVDKSSSTISLTMNKNGCSLTDNQEERGISKVQLLPLDNNFNLIDESVIISLNHLFLIQLISGISKITNKILIEMKSDYPVKITAITPLIKIEQLIAPIIN